MATLTAHTTFTVLTAIATQVETADLTILPENAGANALRELYHPDGVLAKLIYEDFPDAWENFDTVPMTARSLLKGEKTLAGYSLTRWAGYTKDLPVREIWKGSDNASRMGAYFFRRLWEYYVNPPSSGFITWAPKDRTDKVYNIEIESLTAGGQDTVRFDYVPIKNGVIMGEVVLAFRIIGEAA
ncbi:MAG: hypothetical protein ACYC6G_17200 [Desulfobaccales bacterium]